MARGKPEGIRGYEVSRKVLTVNSFPGGARLESARGAALLPSLGIV